MGIGKTKDSSLSKRFITFTGVIFSVLIIFFAAAFNIIINSNSEFLRDALISSAGEMNLERTRLAVEALRMSGAQDQKSVMVVLERHCTQDRGFTQAVLFSKTSDENFFKTEGVLRVTPSMDSEPQTGTVLTEEKDTNYLKEGLLKESTEPKIYLKNGIHWQNIYQPFPVKNRNFVIHFFMAAGKTWGIMENYHSTVKWLRWASIIVCGILIISVIILSVLMAQNHSLLIRNISLYMDKAAKGDLNFSIRSTDDQELNDLALSFNSLIEELRDKSVQEPQDQAGKIFRLGVERMKANNIEDSIAIFRTITLLKPDSFGSFFNLGVAFAKKKNYPLAMKMFTRVLEINPSHEMSKTYLEKVRKLMENGERPATESQSHGG